MHMPMRTRLLLGLLRACRHVDGLRSPRGFITWWLVMGTIAIASSFVWPGTPIAAPIILGAMAPQTLLPWWRRRRQALSVMPSGIMRLYMLAWLIALAAAVAWAWVPADRPLA